MCESSDRLLHTNNTDPEIANIDIRPLKVEIDIPDTCDLEENDIIDIKKSPLSFTLDNATFSDTELEKCKKRSELLQLHHKQDRNVTLHDSFDCNNSILENRIKKTVESGVTISDLGLIYQCNRCEFDSYSLFLWMLHNDNHDDKQKKPINKAKSSKKYLKNKKHKELKCAHCDFRTNKNLERHILSLHTKPEDIKWLQCEHCKYKAKTKDNMKKHIVSKHETFENIKWHCCEYCDYKSKSKINLKRHVINKHAKPEDIKWYQCSHCDYKAKVKDNMKKHLLSNKHDEKSENMNKLHGCAHCNFRTNIVKHLERHIICLHTKPENINWLQCARCEYKAKTKDNMNKHIASKHEITENIKWYYCKYCDYKSKRNFCLKNHVIKHHAM